MENCSCKTGFYLSKNNEIHEILKDNIIHRFHNIRVLRCINCNNIVSIPIIISQICNQIIETNEEKLDESEYNYDFNRLINRYFVDKFISTKINYIYDRDDYYFTPGLIRPWQKGFLAPVFFNIEVLLKYCNHPKYSVELGADTYGYIYKEKEHLISFGINNNGKVIMWLGDINELDLNEQFYLRSENVNSDNNISSQFYEAQIENIWADSSKENKIFSKRKELHELILNAYEFSISQLEPEILKEASSIIRPIVPTEDAFSKVIISMNKIFVESINSKQLSKYFRMKSKINIEGLRGLKLLQLWLENFTNINNPGKIISPLFVLYDLRIAMAHLQSENTIEDLIEKSCTRLNLDEKCRDFLVIYDALINSLNEMYDKLLLLQYNENYEEVTK